MCIRGELCNVSLAPSSTPSLPTAVSHKQNLILKFTDNTVKRAWHRLCFLRRLRKFGMSPKILSNFYSCTVERILINCITKCWGSTTVTDSGHLQWVTNTAEKITGTPLRAGNLPVQRPREGCLHPQGPFPLPTRTSWKCRTSRLKNSLPHCHQTPKQLTGV